MNTNPGDTPGFVFLFYKLYISQVAGNENNVFEFGNMRQ